MGVDRTRISVVNYLLGSTCSQNAVVVLLQRSRATTSALRPAFGALRRVGYEPISLKYAMPRLIHASTGPALKLWDICDEDVSVGLLTASGIVSVLLDGLCAGIGSGVEACR